MEAFVACRTNCVGRELEGIDQEWFSSVDGRKHAFSSFAYEWLSVDVKLDGWLDNTAGLTDSEKQMLRTIPTMESLVLECKAAAMEANNGPVLEFCEQVLSMLKTWNDCIIYADQFRVQQ